MFVDFDVVRSGIVVGPVPITYDSHSLSRRRTDLFSILPHGDHRAGDHDPAATLHTPRTHTPHDLHTTRLLPVLPDCSRLGDYPFIVVVI